MTMLPVVLLLLACNAVGAASVASVASEAASGQGPKSVPCPDEKKAAKTAKNMPKPCCALGTPNNAQKKSMRLAAKAAGRAEELVAAISRQTTLEEASAESPSDDHLAFQAQEAAAKTAKAHIFARDSQLAAEKAKLAVECMFKRKEFRKKEKENERKAFMAKDLQKRLDVAVQQDARAARKMTEDKFSLQNVKKAAHSECIKAAFVAQKLSKAASLARFKAERSREQAEKARKKRALQVLALAQKLAKKQTEAALLQTGTSFEKLHKFKAKIVELLNQRVALWDHLASRAEGFSKKAACKLARARQNTITLRAKAVARAAMAAGAGSRAVAAAKTMLLQESSISIDDSPLAKATAKAAAKALAHAKATAKVEAARKAAAEEAAKIAKADASRAEKVLKRVAGFYENRNAVLADLRRKRDAAYKFMKSESQRLKDMISTTMSEANGVVNANESFAFTKAEYEKSAAERTAAIKTVLLQKSDFAAQKQLAKDAGVAAMRHESNVAETKRAIQLAQRLAAGKSGVAAGLRARVIMEEKIGDEFPERLIRVKKDAAAAQESSDAATAAANDAMANVVSAYRRRCTLRAAYRAALRTAVLEKAVLHTAFEEKQKCDENMAHDANLVSQKEKEVKRLAKRSKALRNHTLTALRQDYERMQMLLLQDKQQRQEGKKSELDEAKREIANLQKDEHNAPIIEVWQTIQLRTAADTLNRYKEKAKKAHQEAREAAIEAAEEEMRTNRKDEVQRQVQMIHAGAVARANELDKLMQRERKVRNAWLDTSGERAKKLKSAILVEAIADSRLKAYKKDKAEARQALQDAAKAKAQVRKAKLSAAKVAAVKAWSRAKFAAAFRASQMAKSLRAAEHDAGIFAKVPLNEDAVELLNRDAVAKAKAYQEATKFMEKTAKTAANARKAATNLDLMKETQTTDFIIAAAKHRKETHDDHLKAVQAAVKARAAFALAFQKAKSATKKLKKTKGCLEEKEGEAKEHLEAIQDALVKATVDVRTLTSKERIALMNRG